MHSWTQSQAPQLSNTERVGDAVGIVAVNSPDFVEQALACLHGGRVIVPLRGIDDTSRKTIAGVGDILLPNPGHGWLKPRYQPNGSLDVAAVMFTSGTEGEPKGVDLTHQALADVVARLNAVMNVDASIREYVGIPVYLSFGFGRCRAVGAAGGEVYIPERGFDPMEIVAMLGKGEINAVSAVPSLWRVVLESAQAFQGVASRLRWIEIGSQPMSAAEKEGLRKLFPAATIVQHYGLTEASRTTFLEIHSAPVEHLGSVGRAYGEVEVRTSEDGRIAIRGPHVTRSVWSHGTATDPCDTDGWYTTPDLGEIRDGYVYFKGRADDLINCGGSKIAPEMLEAQIREATKFGGDFAICRIPDPARGDGVLVAIARPHASQEAALLDAAVRAAERHGVNARGAIVAWVTDELPKTASGKVKRAVLAESYGQAKSRRAAEVEAAIPIRVAATPDGFEPPSSDRERELALIWEEALRMSPISVTDSFYHLGGDSLTAIAVVMRMARAGIDREVCRKIFQGATIRQIATAEARAAEGASATPGTAMTRVDDAVTGVMTANLAVNVVRGILVLAVISGHWAPGIFSRLPAAFRPLFYILAPFFASGTAGFAIVFGLGTGYMQFPAFLKNPERVASVSRTGASLVGGGVLVLATIRLLDGWTSGKHIDSSMFFEAFHGPLLFYTLAILAMVPLLRLVAPVKDTMQRVAIWVALAFVSYAIFMGFDWLVGDIKVIGFLRLMRLMLVAKYSVFVLMTGVLAGVAIGTYFHDNLDSPNVRRRLVLAGAAVVAGAVVLAFLQGEARFILQWTAEVTWRIWKWMFYAGLIMMLTALLHRIAARTNSLHPVGRETMHILSIIGQLALPFYVLQGVVLPAKQLLTTMGLPDIAAILLALCGFGFATWYMIRGLYGLMYSGGPATKTASA